MSISLELFGEYVLQKLVVMIVTETGLLLKANRIEYRSC